MSARTRHCDRLRAGRGPTPAELPCLARVGGALERELRLVFEPLLGASPAVSADAPALVGPDGLAERLPAHGLHVLLTAEGLAGRALLSIGGDGLLMLLDRWFGGTGAPTPCPPPPCPPTLPLSAQLLGERITPRLVDALGAAWSGELPTGLAAAHSAERLGRLNAFAPDEAVVHCRFDVAEAGRPDWAVHATYSADLLRRWSDAAGRRVAPAEEPAPPVADRVGGTLGGVALPLRAIVDEPRLPLRQLNRLAVGDCIPLGVGGLVTLRLADRVVGQGVVGTSNGKVAVRVTMAKPTLALCPPEKDPA